VYIITGSALLAFIELIGHWVIDFTKVTRK
jgi:hypothetical protein